MRRRLAGCLLLVLLAGCGGGGDARPVAAGPDVLPADSPLTPAPAPEPEASPARLWIEGVLVDEPHTLEVTREVDAGGAPVRHRVTIRVPSRGWDVRLSLPTAPIDWQVGQGDAATAGRSEPEREQWTWCTTPGCDEPHRLTIEALVLDGVVYGHGTPAQGASDPCANGAWRPGDPPSPANRQGAVNGVTERLAPVADARLHLWGLDARCLPNAPFPGVRVDFWAPVE